ncbi:MAG TPA: hypothetical protein DD806_08860 [Flavobacterium sp.]|nr:hypothetical protein [Flavobacterium sp.]
MCGIVVQFKKGGCSYTSISNSVANTMDFLAAQGEEELQGSSATARFLRMVNLLFDILNSRSQFAVDSKAPLTPENIALKQRQCQEAVEYLFTLKIGGVPLAQHDRRTFLIGFAAATKSVFGISAAIFQRMPMYKTIETYQFSQDFLECFFGIVRSRLGGNNNPNALEFKYALRRILHRNQLQGNKFSNVEPVGVRMGSLFLLIPVKKPHHDPSFVEENPSLVHKGVLVAFQSASSKNLHELTKHAVYFAGSWVANRILQKLDCESCERALVDQEKKPSSHSGLVAYKDREDARQFFLTNSAFSVIQLAEKVLRHYTGNLHELPINEILRGLRMDFSDEKYFTECRSCPCNINLANHKMALITDLANRYIGLRLSAILKEKNYQFVFHKNPISRHKMNKITLFRGL